MIYAWGALCFYGGCCVATCFWGGLWVAAQIIKPPQRNYGVPDRHNIIEFPKPSATLPRAS